MDARAVLAGAGVVLVDFDGPLTRLLPGRRWLELSAQVRGWAEELGGSALGEALAGEDDHVQCLRAVHRLAPDVVAPLVERVTRAELEAARQARPAEGAVDLLEQCLARGPVAVVTNNHPGVVPLVLDRARPGLTGRLTAVLGRDGRRLQDLKPSPAMLRRVLDRTGADPGTAVLLGDSVTDVRAGEAVGIPVVGVAAEAGPRGRLLAAGAVAVVPGVTHLLDAAPQTASMIGGMTSGVALPEPDPSTVDRLADTVLPTRHGTFRMTAYRDDLGREHVALSVGVADGRRRRRPPLVRVHSECLTGDALGSRRCDCGEQLQHALHLIAQDGYGALVYVGGHEGRGIGLVEKLRAYALQDDGLDTVDANLRLGHLADQRTYGQAAAILDDLGLPEIRLLSSNPAKEHALTELGVRVRSREPLLIPDRPENTAYLRTKRERMGHDLPEADGWAALLRGEQATGPVAERYADLVRPDGPRVLAQLGQSLDGFIASRTGDAVFVTGEEDRAHLHRLRALVDAVVAGAATVVADDPRLTVRAVEGPHPVRVVLDPRGTVPATARVLTDGAAPTLWVVGPGVAPGPVADHVEVLAWPQATAMDPARVLAQLHRRGLDRVLVEGGGRLVSAFVAAGVVDRLYLTAAPVLIGDGVPGLRLAGSDRLADALRPPVVRRWAAGDDVVTELDLAAARSADRSEEVDVADDGAQLS